MPTRETDEQLVAALAALSPEGVARQRRETVARLVGRGWTLQRIADAVGVTKSAVGNWNAR